jgi:hypothetical protein
VDFVSRSLSVSVRYPQPVVARDSRSLLYACFILSAKGLRLQFATVVDQFDGELGPIPSGSYPVAEKCDRRDCPSSKHSEQRYPAL